MSKPKTSLFIFLVIVILIAIIALFGPEEKSLGSNVRIVYLHGAWVITAEIALLLAGASSAMALITRRQVFHRWSAALGRTGIFFWVTYLPLSLWAMQANWNGLFLIALANLAFIIVLRVVFATTANILHPPPSPIFNSGNYAIIGFFVTLIVLSLTASYFLTRTLIKPVE